MGRRVLFAFLGRGPYTPVRYTLGDQQTEKPETFVQAALVELLDDPERPLEVRIGVTREARTIQRDGSASQWESLRERLVGLGDRLQPVEVDLQQDHQPDDGPSHDVAKLWALFDHIGRVFQAGDEVYFDITHGFRSLPVIALLALTFFSKVRGFTVAGIYYGAFESLLNRALREDDGRSFGSGEELDLWCRGGDRVEAHFEAPRTPAPIFELTRMFALAGWTEGVSEWRRTGRADGIVASAKPPVAPDGKATRGQEDFQTKFQALSDALTSVRHNRIAPEANHVIAGLDEMVTHAARMPELAPLRALADVIREDVSPLAVSFGTEGDWGKSQVVTNEYLEHQVAVARWLSDRGRVVEAFTILRELITSCAVRVASDAGIGELDLREQGSEVPRVMKPDTHRFRAAVDYWAQHRSGSLGSKNELDAGTSQAACAAFCGVLDRDEALKRGFRETFKSVRDARNRFDHAWTGAENSKLSREKSRVADAKEVLAKAITDSGTLVERVKMRRGSGT